jgi:hypothetical protein
MTKKILKENHLMKEKKTSKYTQAPQRLSHLVTK